MTAEAGVPRHLVAILLCVIPLSQIPLDVYTPALPQMVTDFASTPTALQGTVTVPCSAAGVEARSVTICGSAGV